MGKKEKPEAFRRRISSDLLTLCQVLQNHSSAVVVNPDVLKSSANQCTRNSKGNSWSYQVAGLQLRVNAPQNCLPADIGKRLIVHVDIDLGGECDDREDCFRSLVVQIRIETETRENLCSWHFDRHITDENSDAPEEAHPLYHFQHGGHAMKEISDSLGRVLLLPTPRLAFPPMDAVLAIDFLLSNFAGGSWKALREEPLYVRLLREAQRRHWKPYIDRLASWWVNEPKEDETAVALWPHLA